MADREQPVATDFIHIAGDRVRITGKHPWDGEEAMIIRMLPTDIAPSGRLLTNRYLLELQSDGLKGHKFVANAENIVRRDA